MSDGRASLAGQAAVVTGGGAGIGRAAALALARRGADVAVIDIDPERAAEAVEAVTALGRRATAFQADATDVDAVARAVAAADDHFGRIDVLVNNVGGVRAARFVDQSERSWRRHIDINLVSALAATSLAATAMVRDGRSGAIVNVSSIEGTRAAPMFAVYGACKAALLSFTRSMAVELGPHGIRTNAVTPDWVRTPGNSGVRSGPVPEPLPSRPAAVERRLAAYVPLGREGLAEECGNVIAFLASPEASYVNGAVIPVDGGTWASSGWNQLPDGGWSLFGSEPMY
ncbi:MAG TPA: SDR family oxidoreductase [Acidimicrobiales bacterium]|jgi:NAD(P)-dependent dehydrogenase (short-subunit alcohol dehydrogenase family)|nr:SDR family oxidoreductase [Acidimicrobiales bacterium]